VPDDDLLSHGNSVLSSACRRFTVLFGMGRGGASGLWSSGVERGSEVRDQGSEKVSALRAWLTWRTESPELRWEGKGIGVELHPGAVAVESSSDLIPDP
jgi:hypothetical protein